MTPKLERLDQEAAQPIFLSTAEKRRQYAHYSKRQKMCAMISEHDIYTWKSWGRWLAFSVTAFAAKIEHLNPMRQYWRFDGKELLRTHGRMLEDKGFIQSGPTEYDACAAVVAALGGLRIEAERRDCEEAQAAEDGANDEMRDGERKTNSNTTTNL